MAVISNFDAIIAPDFYAFLEEHGCLGPDGKFNSVGKKLIGYALEEYMTGKLEDAFVPIRRMAGAPLSAVECVPVDPAQGVILSWRVHPIFGKGWHTAGTYPETLREPKESMLQAVKRTALEELGLIVVPVWQITTVDSTRTNPRFPDTATLYGCRVEGGQVKQPCEDLANPKPNDCAWFIECPLNMLPIQESYISYINEAIRMCDVWLQNKPSEDENKGDRP